MGTHCPGGHDRPALTPPGGIALEGDHPHDECGVFGIFAPREDVARITYFGLFTLQHRGQESAGIAVADGEQIRYHKDMGLVSQVFDEPSLSPLCLASLDGAGTVISSETCALNVVGARFIREIDPGEIISVDREGVCDLAALPEERKALCLFEFIYLARPDSHLYGRSLHEVRRRMGHELAAEHPADAHIVIPVPDTGFPAAIGFAEAS